MRWTEREPYAYWKGNPFVAPTRMDLLSCNASDKQDWHARVYIQVNIIHSFPSNAIFFFYLLTFLELVSS